MIDKAIKRYRRFNGWDYGRGASLFITIATAGRRRLFGRVVGGKMELTSLGMAVYEAIGAIAALNPGIMVFGRVVMPDHVHFNVHLEAGLKEPLKTLGKAIRRFKNYTTALAKRSLAISTAQGAPGPAINPAQGGKGLAINPGQSLQGLASNPAALQSDDGQTAFGQLWQQGYHDRLCLTREFIDATERYIAYNPLKWELMYGDGRETLRIHEKPESRYVAAFAENRYLEIAKGNDEIEFSRHACLDYNAEIVEIANAGEGLALYWKADGPHRL